jgi:hypothetical protein
MPLRAQKDPAADYPPGLQRQLFILKTGSDIVTEEGPAFRHLFCGIGSTGFPTGLETDLDKPFVGQHTVKAFRDVATVRSFFSGHDDEVFAINQNAEVVFRDQLPGWNPDI